MLIYLALFGLIASAQRAILALVISLELLLLAAMLQNAQTYLVLNEQLAQLLIAFMITIAGAETSCALALIVRYWRQLEQIQLKY
jgi:NADH:ubiquinone oxidoreductase subunit K